MALNPIATTNIFENQFTIDEVFDEAYERLGLQVNSGYDLKSARRSLNIMFQEWANRGLHYWEVANTSLTLVQGQSVYTMYRSTSDSAIASDGLTFTSSPNNISPTDTTISINVAFDSAVSKSLPSSGVLQIGSELIFYPQQVFVYNGGFLQLSNVTRGYNGTTAASYLGSTPMSLVVYGVDDILECSYRNSTNIDTPLTKINRSAYQALSNKASQGQPVQYFVQRFIDKVTLTVYLAPSASEAGNFLNFYYVKRIKDAGGYTNAADVPYRFVPCMTAGLAYYLAIKRAPARIQELKLLYEDELMRALEEDGSSSSSFITPKTYYPNI